MKRFAVLLGLLFGATAFAAGPRWVAGSQWTNAGSAMGWYRSDVQYFVDAGPLSASVDHAAAVAVVDAAAAVWNVSGGPPITLTDGGTLAEDVGADNVYLGAAGIVWPQDVSSTNYTAKQIAVVFDADGTLTDTLLGGGASAPANCRTNAVTESVDLFIQPGKIAHAVIVVNGRCSGSAPEQQLQLQYQLMRVFGRVLGLGWSQVNDNVFTGTPAPTYLQQMYWPILHPIDILCGPYTYQCLPQPFTLRPDDIASLFTVYGSSGTSYAGMMQMTGFVAFPGNLPMAGVNIAVRTFQQWGAYGTDPFEVVSVVSGAGLSMNRGNPVTGPGSDTLGVSGAASAGGPNAFYTLTLPITTGASLQFDTEAINPLYVGAYAVGPYRMGSPSPSGSAVALRNGPYGPGRNLFLPYTVPDASADCATGADGTEGAPAVLSPDGGWSGRLCGMGHSSWMSFAVKSGHSATVEVTATDETGNASATKAMPLIGLWHGSDATGTLPGLASAATAFNSSRVGMTQLRTAFNTTEKVRLAVTDARGDGRPDYTYRLRVLYADAVSPSRLPASGGAIVIAGSGFTGGVTVTLGGVAATIVRVSSTEIHAVAPSAAALRSSGAKDVMVMDLSTGGTSAITGGVVYGGTPTDVLTLTSAPAGAVAVGSQATLALRLVDESGAPVKNGVVTLTSTSGSVVFSACNLAQCTVVTDATGAAQTAVTAGAAGAVTVQAASAGGSSASDSYTAVAAAESIALLRPTEYVAAGAGAVFTPSVTVVSNGGAAVGQAVSWSTSTARAGLSATASSVGAAGVSSVSAVGSLRDGEAATLQACAWSNVCATGNLIGVAASSLRAAAVSGDAQNLTASDSLGTVALRIVDGAGHPVAGAAVALYQAVSGWQPPCDSGRCAIAPAYGKSTVTAISDDDGMIAVTPLQYPNTAAVTRITASVGTAGSLTVTLEKSP